jgi:hypothetical protein
MGSRGITYTLCCVGKESGAALGILRVAHCCCLSMFTPGMFKEPQTGRISATPLGAPHPCPVLTASGTSDSSLYKAVARLICIETNKKCLTLLLINKKKFFCRVVFFLFFIRCYLALSIFVV